MAPYGTRRIDLNADVGEGLPAEVDRSLMEVVTSASVACGGHAGDESIMRRTLGVAKELGLRVGAHPSYPDRENFGRRSMPIGAENLRRSLEDQVSLLCDIAGSAGVEIAYLKPHGALYNDAAVDEGLLALLLDLGDRLGLPLMLLGSAGETSNSPGRLTEGFIDRAYRKDGTLVPRDQAGALITDPSAAAQQALALAPSVSSLCVHSDSPSALSLVRSARAALEAAGYEVRP